MVTGSWCLPPIGVFPKTFHPGMFCSDGSMHTRVKLAHKEEITDRLNVWKDPTLQPFKVVLKTALATG